MTVVAMPFALAEIAVLQEADHLRDARGRAEPPHFGTGQASSAAASANPYWVGTKNGLV